MRTPLIHLVSRTARPTVTAVGPRADNSERRASIGDVNTTVREGHTQRGERQVRQHRDTPTSQPSPAEYGQWSHMLRSGLFGAPVIRRPHRCR